MKTIVLILAMACGVIAQTAKVVQLSPADTLAVTQAKSDLDRAQAVWDKLKIDIEHRYISEAMEVTGTSETSFGTIVAGSGLSIGGAGYSDLCAVDLNEPDDRKFARQVWDCRSRLAGRGETARKEKDVTAKLPKHTEYTRKPGWLGGFEFSEDFKFIVPVPTVPISGTRGFWSPADYARQAN